MKSDFEGKQSKGGAETEGVGTTGELIDYLVSQGMRFKISCSRYDR